MGQRYQFLSIRDNQSELQHTNPKTQQLLLRQNTNSHLQFGNIHLDQDAFYGKLQDIDPKRKQEEPLPEQRAVDCFGLRTLHYNNTKTFSALLYYRNSLTSYILNAKQTTELNPLAKFARTYIARLDAIHTSKGLSAIIMEMDHVKNKESYLRWMLEEYPARIKFQEEIKVLIKPYMQQLDNKQFRDSSNFN